MVSKCKVVNRELPVECLLSLLRVHENVELEKYFIKSDLVRDKECTQIIVSKAILKFICFLYSLFFFLNVISLHFNIWPFLKPCCFYEFIEHLQTENDIECLIAYCFKTINLICLSICIFGFS